MSKRPPLIILASMMWFTGGIASAETIITNNTSVTSVTSSSASTGGNSAGNGSVVTTGNASAASYSAIHANSDGGTVEVRVEAEANGIKKEKIVVEELEPGKPVSVEVGAVADSGKGNVDVEVNVVGGFANSGDDEYLENEAEREIMTASDEMIAGESMEPDIGSVGAEDWEWEWRASLIADVANVADSVSSAITIVWEFIKFW